MCVCVCANIDVCLFVSVCLCVFVSVCLYVGGSVSVGVMRACTFVSDVCLCTSPRAQKGEVSQA